MPLVLQSQDTVGIATTVGLRNVFVAVATRIITRLPDAFGLCAMRIARPKNTLQRITRLLIHISHLNCSRPKVVFSPSCQRIIFTEDFPSAELQQKGTGGLAGQFFEVPVVGIAEAVFVGRLVAEVLDKGRRERVERAVAGQCSEGQLPFGAGGFGAEAAKIVVEANTGKSLEVLAGIVSGDLEAEALERVAEVEGEADAGAGMGGVEAVLGREGTANEQAT